MTEPTTTQVGPDAFDAAARALIARRAAGVQRALGQLMSSLAAVRQERPGFDAADAVDEIARDAVRRLLAIGDREPGIAEAQAAQVLARGRRVEPEYGVNFLSDLTRLVDDHPTAVVFDVGANAGQTLRRLRRTLRTCSIHCFEPIPSAADRLEALAANDDRATVVRAAVGASSGVIEVIENDVDKLSSVLELGRAGWGQEKTRHTVKLVALDDYCSERGIAEVALLKIDTQGYELEVLRGAERLLSQRAVKRVLLEMNFAPLYEGMAEADEVLRFLREREFALGALYDLHYLKQRAGWADALFVLDDT